MGYEDILATIKIGKEDKPVLFCDPKQPIMYDINDIDGQYYMLDHEMSGCVCYAFTKHMQPGKGQVTCKSRPVSHVLKQMAIGLDAMWLGIRLRDVLTEYGQTEVIRIEGFTDTDGNEMDPMELTVCAVQKAEPLAQYREHEAVALQAAEEGIVLLKNENGILPLEQDTGLEVFGNGIMEFRTCAVGAGKTNPRYTVGLREALKDSGLLMKENRDKIALVVISRAAGENYDNSSAKGEYCLTDEERALFAELKTKAYKVIAVLNVGYPIETGWIDELGIDAVLYCGFGGMLAGKAIVNILTGRTTPSGRLTDTWSIHYEDHPSSRNFYDCADGKARIGANDSDTWIDTVYEEDIYVGYRYFETFHKKVGFHFGEGLSYTSFEKKLLSIEKESDVIAAVRVTNTGKVKGKETVLLFVSKPQTAIEKPEKELIGFAKTGELAPQEYEDLVIEIPRNRFSGFDEEKGAFVLEEGEYRIFLGDDVSRAKQIETLVLTKTEILKKVNRYMQPDCPIDRVTQKRGTMPKGEKSGVSTGKWTGRAVHFSQTAEEWEKSSESKITFAETIENPALCEQYVKQLDAKTLARIVICAKDGWGMDGTGEAGRLFKPEGLDLPDMIVSDGNSGVNMRAKNIGMPSGVTLCSSYNMQLMEEVGRVIGEEAKELNVNIILAPALNLHRNPLNGRQPEYFSEDPLLAGIMAGHYCEGLESTGVGGCYKHLICNNAETSRKRNQSIVSERAIRELYFRAFAYALETYQPISVMTAYNGVNGVFTSEDEELIQGLLREEAGFRGFVMTDWESYSTADIVSMEKAGNTWITPGSEDDRFTKQIEDAIEDGRLSIGRLRENAYYLIHALAILAGRNR